jgi:hypothetical protein
MFKALLSIFQHAAASEITQLATTWLFIAIQPKRGGDSPPLEGAVDYRTGLGWRLIISPQYFFKLTF